MNNNEVHALERESIGKLLLNYSLPAIIGMSVTSLYNIIDSIFIGHGVGSLAISALAVCFPMMNLIIAFCMLVGAGGGTIASIRLGQKNHRDATIVLSHTLTLSIILSVTFSTISLIFLEDILYLFGASNDTLPYAVEFMQIILMGTPISYVMISLNNVMRATGYPKKAMLTSIITVVCNLVIAPILIFWADMGMRGAAIATVFSQLVGMVWIVAHFINDKHTIHFERGTWAINSHITKSIVGIGLSPFMVNICGSLIIIVINNSLKQYGGDLAIGAYGIINRVLTLYTMTVIGLSMGMQPIIGYNYGAKNYARVEKTLKTGIITGVVITSSGFIICEAIPHFVSAFFTDNKELINMSASGLRYIILMFPLVGAQIVIGNYFQSIGKAKISIFLSMTRQLIYLLPALIILPFFFGLNGIWLSIPFSDVLAFTTSVICILAYRNKHKHKRITT